MTNNKKTYVEDIRRIAKTDEILKKIPNIILDKDKATIGTNRGIGYPTTSFDPCQFLYTSEDGRYTYEAIMSGNGPKLVDGDNNQCSLLNTITGMREIGIDPTLKLILKPDGLFLDDATPEYWYTSDLILSDWENSPENYSTNSLWAFATPEEAANKTQELWYAGQTFYNDTGTSGTATDPSPTTITTSDIEPYNYSDTYPLYLTTVSASGNAADTTIWNTSAGNTGYVQLYTSPNMSTKYNSSITSNYVGDPDPNLQAPPTFLYAGDYATDNASYLAITPTYYNAANTSTTSSYTYPAIYYSTLSFGIWGGGSGIFIQTWYYKYTDTHVEIEEEYLIWSIPSNYNANLDPTGTRWDPPIVDSPVFDVGVFYFMQNNNPSAMPTSDNSFQIALSQTSRIWETDGTNPLNPLQYANGVSSVKFEFGTDYTRTGLVRPAKDGGFALLELSGSTVIGTAYIFRQNRTLAAVVPAAQVSSFLA